MKVLILSVSAGFGHIKVSKSLKDFIKIQDTNNEVEIVDILEYVSPVLNKLFTEYYLRALKYIPEIYSYLYKKEAQEATLQSKKKKKRKNKRFKISSNEIENKEEIKISDIFNKIVLEKKLRELIEETSPDWIISTHPFIGELLEVMEEKEELKSKIMTIVTDYVVHPSWISTSTDYYIFPSERLSCELDTLNVDMKKVRFFGIPIDPKFRKKLDKESIYKKYKIKENRFTYLLMGGGYGIGNLEKETRLLLEWEKDCNIIVICGKNKELYKAIKDIEDERIHPFEFTEDINELMGISDIIISKPGGLTLTECIATGVPIAIKEYLPGQEERNVQFILNNHLGIYAKDEISFIAYLRLIKRDEDYRNKLIESIKKLQKTDTLENIYKLLSEKI